MSEVESILIALAPAIAKLIETALSSTYDPEAERQALLHATRALEDLRAAKALK